MLGLALAAALLAQSPPPKAPAPTPMPTLTLPKGLSSTFGKSAVSFGATITIDVKGVPRPPAPKTKPTPQQLAVGEKLYKQRCVLCHGDAGAADGVGARRIQPEPQHLNAVLWQQNVSDEEIGKAILDGGAAVSRSPMMPANPDLKSRPADVTALVQYVRTLRAKFGSTLASVVLADNSSRAAHAEADEKGNAKIVLADLPKGKATITVMIDGEGTVGCTLELNVEKDATVPCVAPPPAKK